MEEEESAIVPSSAVEETTPSEEPVTEGEQATVPEPTLYELPDGRKLTGEELKDNYLNLNSEFTRKSQELAKFNQPKSEPAPQDNPKWIPNSYQELLQVAEQRVLTRIEQQQMSELKAKSDAEAMVSAEVAELKKSDPNLNEGKLYQHAAKYQFSNLKLAYENMKEIGLIAKATEAKVVSNMKSRSEPVAGNSSANNNSSTVEYRPGLSAKEVFARLKS